jgi:phospholipid/cholesterol/gamma-HCH transport system permease protein
LFFAQVFQSLTFSDLLPAIIKTFFFGFAVGMVGCYKGFNSIKGTRGVGISANSAVVLSSVIIFFIDLLAVQFTNVFGLN